MFFLFIDKNMPLSWVATTYFSIKRNGYIFKGGNSVKSVIFSIVKKRSTLKGEEFAPIGCILFPFIVDLFAEGTLHTGKQTRCQKELYPS